MAANMAPRGPRGTQLQVTSFLAVLTERSSDTESAYSIWLGPRYKEIIFISYINTFNNFEMLKLHKTL